MLEPERGQTAPRTITAGYMGPGSRADWLVRCPAGTHSFITNGRRRLNLERDGGLGDAAPGADGAIAGRRLQKGGGAETIAQMLATIIAEDVGDTACSLGTFSHTPPCYLIDLTGAPGR